ncbi:MAG: tetratricopeptide repeat protein, partial [Chloroflexaceae bacterium]|nr:tetratricopeptide repeat protein [Chloroflexaceae bacterium]
MGKTNLAVEFVHRYGQFFAGGVFWVSFADPKGIDAEIAACGGSRAMVLRPDFASLPLEEQVAAVQRAWDSPIPRLLIFDNLDDDEAASILKRWRPTTGGCRVLLTSRRARWDGLPFRVTSHALGVLSAEESRTLLLRFRADLVPAEADALAAELGHLPLALHLAGSYLQRYQHVTLPAYLDELRQVDMLAHASLEGTTIEALPTTHERSVARTFALSYRRLQRDNPIDRLARALLARAAHFAPGEPLERAWLLATVTPKQPVKQKRSLLGSVLSLFGRGHRSTEGHQGQLPTTAEAHTDALQRLTDLGLLSAEGNERVSLHRLLAHFVQQQASDEHAQADVERVLVAIAEERNERGIPADVLPLLPHLRYATTVALPRKDETAVWLANKLGYALRHMLADYAGARPLYEQALAISEATLVADHPATTESMHNLADLLRVQGEFSRARKLHERVISVRKQTLGEIHTDTALSLDSLAELLYDQGLYDEARPLYERALAIRKQVLGPTHPATATSLNNLAGLLDAQGAYEEA